MAELTRPVADANQSRRTADIAGGDASQSLAANNDRPADKPRRLLPSWFRGQEQLSVPLPTTPGDDNLAAESPTGPVEQFQ